MAILGAAALGAGATAYSANKAQKAQKQAAQQSLQAQRKIAQQQDQAFNAANRKKPNVAAMMGVNRAGGGISSTFLTGPSGAAASSGQLGRTTLLGA